MNIQSIQKEYDEVTQQLGDLTNLSPADQGRLYKRQSDLKDTLDLAETIQKLEAEIAEHQDTVKGGDPELAELATEELPILESRLTELAVKLEERLIPHDPTDDRDAIVEIRAGAGGDEAGIFAGELMRMYMRYAATQGWTVEILDTSENEAGGVREAVFKITSDGAFGQLKYESGVHRVQRVPETEAKGRVHTSTATVAVLPVAEEVDVEIKSEDLRIDVFRAGGNGGQSVNTTDSAVRITHLPTGITAACQDEKSQTKNKEKAMGVLRSRLLAAQREKLDSERADARRSQIGSGDRSEKIRTYNFPQDRITDHRIGANWHNIDNILAGDLGEIIATLKAEEIKQLKTSEG